MNKTCKKINYNKNLTIVSSRDLLREKFIKYKIDKIDKNQILVSEEKRQCDDCKVFIVINFLHVLFTTDLGGAPAELLEHILHKSH